MELVLDLELRDVAARVLGAPEDKAAPDTLNPEVLHAIRAHERLRGLTTEASDGARRTLAELPITRYPTLLLLDRAWELRHNLTTYDAMYVALAEAIGTTFVTADARLARAAREHTSLEVELLAVTAG